MRCYFPQPIERPSQWRPLHRDARFRKPGTCSGAAVANKTCRPAAKSRVDGRRGRLASGVMSVYLFTGFSTTLRAAGSVRGIRAIRYAGHGTAVCASRLRGSSTLNHAPAANASRRLSQHGPPTPASRRVMPQSRLKQVASMNEHPGSQSLQACHEHTRTMTSPVKSLLRPPATSSFLLRIHALLTMAQIQSP
jgi:hypothetical protein